MQKSLLVLYLCETWPDIDQPQAFELQLQEAFPGIDLLAEAKKARLWETTARAAKKNHRRFFVNWLRRSKATLLVRGGAPSSRATTLGSGYQLALEDALKNQAQQRARSETLRTREYLRKQLAVERTSPEEALDRISVLLRKLDTQ